MAILNGIKFTDSDEVHKLDYEKALENKPTLVKSFNDLEDKPFYVEGVMEIDILPKADYAFENNEHPQEELFGLVDGNTYKVEYDGTLYECVCVMFEAEIGQVYFIGNDSEFGGTNVDIPFIIIDSPTMNVGMIIAIGEGNTHNIRIYHDGEAVHQLDPKYVNAYTKEEIDNLVKTLSLKIQTMFDNLIDGDEVAY